MEIDRWAAGNEDNVITNFDGVIVATDYNARDNLLHTTVEVMP